MSINETKVTVFALPLGLMVTAIVGSPPHKRISVATHASLAIVAGALIFVPLYDFFNSWNNYDPDRGRIQDFLTNPGGMSSYLDTHATVGSGKEAGRVDAVTVPLQVLAHDPVRLSFGFGIGNATRSNLGPQFTGRYGAIYSAYTVETSMATFMLEIGVFGTILILLLQWFIFRDAIYVMRADQGLVGIIGLGWIGASIIVSACNFYITLHTSEALSYMFWFFSGLIVAKRTRLSLAQPQSYQFAIAAPNNQFGLLK
jgi:hypothetical protein